MSIALNSILDKRVQACDALDYETGDLLKSLTASCISVSFNERVDERAIRRTT